MLTNMNQDVGSPESDSSEAHRSWVDRISRALENSEVISLAPGGHPYEGVNSADGVTWGEDRQIPASAIREALLRPDLGVSENGLRIDAAAIVGHLDLSSQTIATSLTFGRCYFSEYVDLQGATLGDVSFQQCRVDGLTLDGATIAGMDLHSAVVSDAITAIGTHFESSVSMWGARLVALEAAGAVIEGRLQMSGSVISGLNGRAIDLTDATIEYELDLSGAECSGTITLDTAKIGDGVNLKAAILSSPIDTALLAPTGTEDTTDAIQSEAYIAELRKTEALLLSERVRAASAALDRPERLELAESRAVGAKSILDSRFQVALLSARFLTFYLSFIVIAGTIVPLFYLIKPDTEWIVSREDAPLMMGFAALSGFIAMAVVETLKRLTPLRGAVQFLLVQRWLMQRGVSSAERAHVAEVLAGGRKADKTPKTIGTWGFTSAHNLAPEQLVGQLAQAAEDSKRIRRALGGDDTASLDRLSIYLSGAWRATVQASSWALSGLVSVAIGSITDGPQMLAGWLLGGVLSWVFRDVAAAIERLRS